MHKFLEAVNIITSSISLLLTVCNGISVGQRRGEEARCGRYTGKRRNNIISR
jgi:hypothetical protein